LFCRTYRLDDGLTRIDAALSDQLFARLRPASWEKVFAGKAGPGQVHNCVSAICVMPPTLGAGCIPFFNASAGRDILHPFGIAAEEDHVVAVAEQVCRKRPTDQSAPSGDDHAHPCTSA
jgi:hypothetical protein